jgi:tetratricopeptide (TPR) repeat protein
MSALLAARTGHIEEATRAADALRLEFPFDTIVQKYGLPLIEATVRLHLNDPAAAVAALEPATKYDLSYTNSIFPTLYSSYLRGTAYFRLNEFASAAAEFQRILTHPGLVGRWVFGPLARLHLARTHRAMGDDAAALSSYETFLKLWQGADADIPLYQDAKAEYHTLRNRP